MKNFYAIVVTAMVVLVLEGEAASIPRTESDYKHDLGRPMTLGTFNAAINPFFKGINATAELRERTELLIQEVVIDTY